MEHKLLLIRIKDDAAEWARVGGDGAVLEGPHSGPPEAGHAAGNRVVVLVPGTRVLMTSTILPTRNRGKLSRALPFAVEDQLACDVESQHIAAGPQDDVGRVPVAVVAREDMRRWLSALSEVGLKPDAMVPDYLALDTSGDAAAIVLDNGSALVRTGPEAFSCPVENLPVYWAALEQKPTTATLWDGRGGNQPIADLPGTQLERRNRPDAGIELMAQGACDAPINLLQGEFAPRQEAQASMRLWRVTAAAAALFFLITLAFGVSDYFLLRAQADELHAQIEQTFQQALPEVPLRNARVQMEQALVAQGIEQGSLLSMLAGTAMAVEAQPELSLQAMEYRDDALMVRLKAPSITALDNLRNALQATASFKVEVASATATEEGVDGRVVISRRGK